MERTSALSPIGSARPHNQHSKIEIKSTQFCSIFANAAKTKPSQCQTFPRTFLDQNILHKLTTLRPLVERQPPLGHDPVCEIVLNSGECNLFDTITTRRIQTRKTRTPSARRLAAQEATPVSNPLRTSPLSTSTSSGRTVSDRHSSSTGRTDSDHRSSSRAPPTNSRRTAHGSEAVSRATSNDPPARRRGQPSSAAARQSNAQDATDPHTSNGSHGPEDGRSLKLDLFVVLLENLKPFRLPDYYLSG